MPFRDILQMENLITHRLNDMPTEVSQCKPMANSPFLILQTSDVSAMMFWHNKSTFVSVIFPHHHPPKAELLLSRSQ